MATEMVVRVRIAAAIQINQSYSTGGANVDPSSSAYEVTTLWHYTNMLIIIIIIFCFFLTQVVKIPGVKNYKS